MQSGRSVPWVPVQQTGTTPTGIPFFIVSAQIKSGGGEDTADFAIAFIIESRGVRIKIICICAASAFIPRNLNPLLREAILLAHHRRGRGHAEGAAEGSSVASMFRYEPKPCVREVKARATTSVLDTVFIPRWLAAAVE
eukprot:CAMPEP_0119261610 /NCGR_PEP_ID=MMETSP1329-20130426/1621_1 /TAXON_ID=114041 /ORGANISM="Genus nov. species nov., Strain RCC1024" /LENGTH=138 /DNA_ID=CAMNT_0007261181 /DNA_START=62 /DNA_END=477 /DNA_ORIENTATION=+